MKQRRLRATTLQGTIEKSPILRNIEKFLIGNKSIISHFGGDNSNFFWTVDSIYFSLLMNGYFNHFYFSAKNKFRGQII